MRIQVRKVDEVKSHEPVIFLIPNVDFDISAMDFSSMEKDFIASELKKEKKFVEINQFSTWKYIQVLEGGKGESFKSIESARKAGDKFASKVNSQKFERVFICQKGVEDEYLTAFVEGMILGNYQFLKYRKNQEKEQNKLKFIEIQSTVSEKVLHELGVVCEATCIARDLVNEPVIYLTATQLSEEFKKLGKDAGFTVEVLDKMKIESLKMGGLLAVNAGSIEPPTFSVMEYKPANAKNAKPIVLVGKGVVYDTGGLSLKPTPNSMDMMKCDMAGGAAVGAALYAIAKAGLPVHVVGIVPATDNRPGENAYTPGDVITMYSGLNVEVLNTDAEGRMILADALWYAKKYDPELVLDFATLTGAAAAAIGPYGTVCMGTASEDVKQKLKKSGDSVYERLVEFPFWDEYDDLIKSDIAEIKNIGGPVGGAITAGKFLARFIDYPWMHFDIAGPAFIKGADSYRGKNGTGVGVRLLFDFIKNI